MLTGDYGDFAGEAAGVGCHVEQLMLRCVSSLDSTIPFYPKTGVVSPLFKRLTMEMNHSDVLPTLSTHFEAALQY